MAIDGYKHIAERPVDPIGQPSVAGNTFTNTSNTYDCAIAGLPFFFAVNDKYPSKRETARTVNSKLINRKSLANRH